MLTVYHYWSSVCSQKVRLALAEKAIPWESRHVDLFTFQHWEPEYKALNRKAVVPTIDHDGKVLTESNVIVEYLEDAFQGPRLRPEDPYLAGLMRRWIYDTEEIAHPNVNTLSYNARHKPRLQGYPKDELRAIAAKCPNPVISRRFLKRVAEGVSPQEEADAYASLDHLLDGMERSLGERGPWLLGKDYSLADVAMAPFVNRIEVLPRPEMVGAKLRPRIAEWWQRIQARPAYKEAFSFKNPNAANDPVAMATGR
jgi:glutathione S-transferase